MNKQGFTLIEMLVASLLLGMLVVILTMVFNSSSSAWRTGKAGVAEMDRTRRKISLMQRQADSAIAVNGQMYQVCSPWKYDSSSGSLSLRNRSIDNLSGSTYGVPAAALSEMRNPSGGWTGWSKADVNQAASSSGSASYTVGVTSWGPDGKRDTDDDITSWPGEDAL